VQEGGYGWGVLRTALRPRWLGLLLVALVAASVMVLLGHWQLGRAREHGREPVERQARAQVTAVPKPLDQVIKGRQTFPRSAVNLRVTATGHWDYGHRLLVTDRTLNGRSGYWVLVPLKLADGSALPVVRGWVASPAALAAAESPSPLRGPPGAVQVVGLLQPTEAPLDHTPGESDRLPADQLARIAATDLVNRWSFPLITGFLVMQSQTPATGPSLAPVPPPTPDSGLDLLNVFYAFQWWLFAGVALFFWWRLVRDDHLRRPDAAAGADPGPDPEPEAPVPAPDGVSRVTT
jgi:cytochrome oxidase assembly protein ShyY1